MILKTEIKRTIETKRTIKMRRTSVEILQTIETTYEMNETNDAVFTCWRKRYLCLKLNFEPKVWFKKNMYV